MCSTVKEVIWLRKLANELGIIENEPTLILCDNESAIKIASNEKSSQRTRHMSVQAAYPREQLDKGEIDIQHVKTDYQLADMLTKPTTAAKFIKNRGKLMCKTVGIFAMIACYLIQMMMLIAGTEFEKSSPINWVETNHYVEAGNIDYSLKLKFESPCLYIKRQYRGDIESDPVRLGNLQHNTIKRNTTVISMSEDTRESVDTYYSVIKQLVRDCEQFASSWRAELIELSNMQKLSDNRISKRGLFDFGAGLVTGIAVTNLVSTVFEYINPNSQYHRLGRLEESAIKEKEIIESFSKNLEDLKVLEKGMLDSISEINHKVDVNSKKLQELTILLPHVSWTAAYLQMKIVRSHQDIKQLKRKFITGKVGTKELANLLNFTKLEAIDDDQTDFRSVEVDRATDIFTFNFSIRDKKKEMKIYRLDPFKIWLNLTTTPVYAEYYGKPFVLYNKSADCVKGLDDPITKGIIDNCATPHGRDPSITLWRKSDVPRHHILPEVKRNQLTNNVYCYLWNIQIDNHLYKCPPFVFKFSTQHSFKIGELYYEAISIHGNVSMLDRPLDKLALIDYVFINHTNDELSLIERINELKANLTEMKIRHESSLHFEQYDVNWWLALIICIISLGLVIFFIRQLCKSNNEVVYATVRRRVIDRDYSDGFELMDRQKPSTSKKMKGPTPPPPLN